MSRKSTKSRTRGRKLHLTKAKARAGRARKTRADLERQLKACKREIANARERLIEATKQQTATSEMLRIISDSPLQSVLDAVAEHAARLCDSNHAEIYRLENNLIRLVAAYGDFPVHSQASEGFPVNRDRVIGRTICDRRSVHVHDLAAEDSEYPAGSSDAKRLGHRTTLGTPLLRERTPIGGILFRRFEVRPFSDNQIALLESFANQAAIVIENVRLFEAEKQRTLALAQANRDLAEREARIQRLVDANIIGIVIWNLDGQINDANDAFLRMVGYDREDLLAGCIRWTDLTPPELRKRNEQTLEELNRSGTTQPFEKEYFRKDGSRVPVLIGRAIFEEGGNQGVAFVLDLTERKRAEKALHESEERFRTLMQFSFDVYWETDAQHRFIRQDFSERVTDGPLPDSELGKTRWEMPYLEIDEEGWREHREMLDAHLPFRDLEYARPTPNGGKRWAGVSGLPLFDEAGRFIGYRGVARHITERKLIEEALRQREKELREIVETIPAMTVTITADGRDAFIGKRFSEYSGLSEEEARGSGWKVTVHPDDLDLYLRKWRASLASGAPVEFETRVRRADGEYRWFLARAVAQRDENGNILKWYEVLTDIEDRKRAEAVLRDSEAQVRRLVDANIIGVFTWRLGRGDEAGDSFIQDVNDAFLRIVGYDRNDLAGGAVSQRILTPPDWQDRTERAMAEMKLTGAFQPYEKEYIRKDGSRVPVLVGAAQFGETGDHGVAFVLDLTEQKRAAAALRERDATVRGLVDANIIGTFTWRRDKAGGAGFRPVFQDVNDAFLRIVGYDREDLATGTSTWIFTPPDWVDRTQRAADEMQLNGAFQPYEKEFIRKDGSRVPVLVGAAQTGDSGIAFVLDLTEQKRAEAVLRESEARVRHLIDANIIGIFIGDFDGNIVDANDTYLRLLGYDREDLLSGRINWVTITPPELLYRSERALQEMKSVGKARLYEKEYIRKDGSRVPALVGATIFGEGRGLGLLCSI